MKKYSLLFLSALVLSACSQQINVASKIPLPERFEKVQEVKTQADISHWWRNWQDPQLNRLIEQGLAQNLDIAIARARIAEAQANSQYRSADLGPNLGLSGAAGAVNSEIRNPLNGQYHDHQGNLLSGALTASWEIDFFGKKRSDRDAAAFAALSQKQQLYATQMLVAAQIAESYANIAALREQQALTQQNLQQLKKLQNYLQARFNAAQANANDVQQVMVKMSAIEAQLSTFDSQIAANERAIALLLGKTPENFQINDNQAFLKTIPATPQGQLPSEVLARRPDIAVAQAQVQALSAKLASAKADLYPRFEINFLGQTGRLEIASDIPDLKGWTSLIGVNLHLPLFTNGRIQANIDAADARLKGALAQYDKSILQALTEVENAYQSQFALAKQSKLMQQAANLAKTQTANAEKLFNLGNQTLDHLVNSRLTLLEYQNRLVQSRLAQAKNIIGLYKAIGGGY